MTSFDVARQIRLAGTVLVTTTIRRHSPYGNRIAELTHQNQVPAVRYALLHPSLTASRQSANLMLHAVLRAARDAARGVAPNWSSGSGGHAGEAVFRRDETVAEIARLSPRPVLFLDEPTRPDPQSRNQPGRTSST